MSEKNIWHIVKEIESGKIIYSGDSFNYKKSEKPFFYNDVCIEKTYDKVIFTSKIARPPRFSNETEEVVHSTKTIEFKLD